MNSNELYWLAGLLEGEGSFTMSRGISVRVQLAMTDKEPVEKAAALMGSKVTERKVRYDWKLVYRTELCGAEAVRSLLIQLEPLMSPRRKQAIRKLLQRCSEVIENRASAKQKAILVRYLVQEMGLSQAYVSKVTGIGDGSVSLVVNGKQNHIGLIGRR